MGADPRRLLANGGWQPGDRAVELAKRQFQQAPGRAEFEARLAANPEGLAGRKLQEELQHHRQEQDKAKAEQARLDKIAATQRKRAEEAVDVVMRDGADRLIE